MPNNKFTRVVSTRSTRSKNRNRNIYIKTLRAKLYKLLSTNPEKFDRIIGKLKDDEVVDLLYGDFKGLRLSNKP